MHKVVQLRDGSILNLQQNALGKGGEGEVYAINHPAGLRNKVVKILHLEKRDSREERIAYMVNHPPGTLFDDNHHTFLIWPEQLVYDKGEWIGFTMEKVDGIPLKSLCYPFLPQKIKTDWQFLDRGEDKNLLKRLQICKNIALALAALHSSDQYVAGDLKPDNILIQQDGRVAIIDLDSCQIKDSSGSVLHKAGMASPGYTPPDRDDEKTERYDNFILGVIFYELLTGLNPYTGSCKPPYHDLTTPGQKIKHGLFPHGSKNKFFSVVPPPHALFFSLTQQVQNLFTKCLDLGANDPLTRPSCQEWVDALLPEVVIDYFTVDREAVLEGMTVVLSWSVRNADRVTLQPGNRDIGQFGNLSIPIKEFTAFELMASTYGSSQKAQAIVRVFGTPEIKFIPVHLPKFTSSVAIRSVNLTALNISANIDLPNLSLPSFIHSPPPVQEFYLPDDFLVIKWRAQFSQAFNYVKNYIATYR